jgi:hypothetical protein
MAQHLAEADAHLRAAGRIPGTAEPEVPTTRWPTIFDIDTHERLVRPAPAMVNQSDPAGTVSPVCGWLLPDYYDGALEVRRRG